MMQAVLADLGLIFWLDTSSLRGEPGGAQGARATSAA